MSLDLNSTDVEYKDNKVIIKGIPKNGENLSVFMRPGDEVVFDIEGFDPDELEYILVGGDIVVSFANEGVLTFPSLGLMGFSSNPPKFSFGNNKSISVDNILSKIEEVNELPITSVDASFKVTTSNNEDDEAPTGVQADEAKPIQVIVVPQTQTISDAQSRRENFSKENENDSISSFNSNPEPISKSTPTSSPYANPYSEYTKPNDFDAYYDENLVPKPDENLVPDTGFTGMGDGDGTGVGPGNVDDAAKPVFYFKATAHQVTYKESVNDEGTPLILGGGGSLEGYKFDSVTNQYETETIDISARSEDMIIRTEDSTYFNNDGSVGATNYLSRVLRFEPQMPEGFYIDSFFISGFPAGVEIFDKNGDKIAGSLISKEQMIFKDSLGNIIDFDSPNFITTFKSAEFIIKYNDNISDAFKTTITASYKLDEAYIGTTDLPSVNTYENEYTFALKDITKADDYTYKKEEFTDGADEGFILSKEPNTNTIKDGSGNSTIVGGLGTDIVYDGAGDDTIYLSAGSDIVYGGAGNNTIYGDTYLKENEDGTTTEILYSDGRDKISYAEVKSFSLAELEYLKTNNIISNEEYQKLSGSFEELDENDNPIPNSLDVDMLNYYKGVYVDLDGFTDKDTLWIDSNDNGIVDDDEKINALSKFALRDDNSFTYNDDGEVTSTTITDTGLSNIQLIGQDKLANIEDVDGSAYNDTIYGNDLKNIIKGLGGSDILDGRGGGNELYGGAGYDILFSGSGDDYLDGGEDTDTVNYQNLKSDLIYGTTGGVEGVIVRLDKPSGNTEDKDFATGFGSDTLVNIEDVVGSNYDDIIYGSSGTNYIKGMGGDDKIISGRGYDFIDGGEGSDWISYYMPDYPDRVTNPDYMEDIQGITVTMGNDFVMVKETTTDRLIDLIKDIEQVSGTRGNDFIWGDGSDETFWGHEGNDNLRGWGGNDKLYGGAGDDFLLPGRGVDYSDGGSGVDFLHLYYDALRSKSVQQIRLSDEAGKVGTVQYSTDSGSTWNDGYLTPESHNDNTVYKSTIFNIDNLSKADNIEGLHGSSGADYIIGNSQDNRFIGHNGDDEIYGMGGDDFISGGNGADKIYGGDGNDTLYGDADDDLIEGGAGDDTIYGYSVYNWSITNRDTIDGGEGFDTLNYSSAHHGGFILDMRTLDANGYADVKFNASTSTSNKAGPGAFDDKIKNIESIIGSRHNDEIRANDTGMTLDGWSGVDELYGGAGNDTIIARNSAGEILDGGAGTDTLKLAQSVDFRNRISISNFEVLELGNYTAYINLSSNATYNQWDTNSFNKIVGGDNSRLNLYGTTGDDNFDFKNLDFTDFSGIIYTAASSGNDTVDLTHVTSIDKVRFYLDGSSGSDTLKVGLAEGTTTNPLTVKLLDNYYNTFEKFEVASGSTLEVNAYNNSGRTFRADTKDFDAVSGEINFIGGSGNDTFYAHLDKFNTMLGKITLDGGAGNDTFLFNYESLLNGNLKIDGGSGIDTVDVRSTGSANLKFDQADIFNNIEKLMLTNSSTRTKSIEIDAEAMKDWFSADIFTLDLMDNNSQANNVTISNAKEITNANEISIGNFTGFKIDQVYSITLDDDTSFQMQVV